MKKIRFLIIIPLVFIGSISKKVKSELFNGRNFDGWYTYLEKKGKNKDPEKVFSIDEGTIHITGKEFGYLATNTSFKNYRLILEFRWGENKYAPRIKQKRDSGIIYHVRDYIVDKIWPRGIEYQVQEGDCGDFWLIGGVKLKSNNKNIEINGLTNIKKTVDAEKPWGEWNSVEIIVNNGKCSHLLNGMVINEGYASTVNEGKILLQSEGAEIYYRKISIETL